MTENQIKKGLIGKAKAELEKAEALAHAIQDVSSESYFNAMCDIFPLKDAYYQLLHFYGETVSLNQFELQLKFSRQMTQYQFEITEIRDDIIQLKDALHDVWNTDRLKAGEYRRAILALTRELSSKMQFAAAFELRSIQSINGKK